MKKILCFLYAIIGWVSVSFAQTPHAEIYQDFELAQNAEFPGGIVSFRKLVEQNAKRPDSKNTKEGTVVVSFVVGKDGMIETPKVMKSVDATFDKVAIEAVLSTKNTAWIPARNTQNEVVKVRKVIPIKFSK